MHSYDNQNNAIDCSVEATQPFREALSALGKGHYYAELLQNSTIDRLTEVGSELTHGIIDPNLSAYFEELYKSLKDYQITVDVLGEGLVRPSVYKRLSSTLLKLSDKIDIFDAGTAFGNLTTGSTVVSTAVDSVTNPTWLFADGTWNVAKTALSAINTVGIGEGGIAKLLGLEHETSLLPGIDKLTSAASQITSITGALGSQRGWIARLLSDYAEFATNQHRAIHKMADDESEVSWRLEALDAASKLVDRQVRWSEEFTDAFSSVTLVEEDNTEEEEAPSILSIYPQHIAYSKRKNVEIGPEEALAESKLVEITEKGKKVSENIVLINRLMEDRGEELVFKYTSKAAMGLINMSTIVCTSDNLMGKIIDDLYFIFYENLESIKAVIGNGDKKAGDRMVRSGDVYQCIFNVKVIRNDFRHDLDHGDDRSVQKKLRNIGECYKYYCNRRPLKARDYKILQLNLYNEFVTLTDSLIEAITAEVLDS